MIFGKVLASTRGAPHHQPQTAEFRGVHTRDPWRTPGSRRLFSRFRGDLAEANRVQTAQWRIIGEYMQSSEPNALVLAFITTCFSGLLESIREIQVKIPAFSKIAGRRSFFKLIVRTH